MHKACFILFIILFAFKSFSQSNEPQTEILKKMISLKNALIAKDSVSLCTLLADDVTYGHSNGLMQTKTQLIRSVMSGEQDYKSIEPSDINVRMYDKAGVVTTKSKVDLIYSGKPLSLNMYITLTWIKMKSDWKLVSRQSVKLPE